MQLESMLQNFIGSSHVDCGNGFPTRDDLASLWKRIRLILKIENVRPRQFQLSQSHSPLNVKLGFSFQPNSKLGLIIERTIEAAVVEIDACWHGRSELSIRRASTQNHSWDAPRRKPRVLQSRHAATDLLDDLLPRLDWRLLRNLMGYAFHLLAAESEMTSPSAYSRQRG